MEEAAEAECGLIQEHDEFHFTFSPLFTTFGIFFILTCSLTDSFFSVACSFHHYCVFVAFSRLPFYGLENAPGSLKLQFKTAFLS